MSTIHFNQKKTATRRTPNDKVLQTGLSPEEKIESSSIKPTVDKIIADE